jgi:hypothetical protein
MSDKLVTALLNDFVDVYQLLTRNRRRSKALMEINQGLCGVVAKVVGDVLVKKYNYNPDGIQHCNHCLHMWLRVGGIDYDTLYPTGYNQPVVNTWLLDQINYNTVHHVVAISEVENIGWVDREILRLIDVFYYRHGLVNLCSDEYTIDGLVGKLNTKTARKDRRICRRINLVYNLPEFVVTEHKTNVEVFPITHYKHGEFEENCNRILKPLPTDLRACKLARVIKYRRAIKLEYLLSGIEYTRM